jgi:poly-gamma-glutamate synthesis protein (capsule biosynthesis protein)
VRAVSIANNHMLDYGATGMMDTRRHLARSGIAFAGAGANASEAAAPALFRLGQVTFGLVSLTDNMPEWCATEERPGVHYARFGGSVGLLARLREMVMDLRSRGADCVVLSVHWGWLPVPLVGPRWRFRRFARQAIDAGIDIVHGHSAHLLQGVERYGRGIILYDAANFLDDYWVFPGVRTDRSALFLMEFDGSRPSRLGAIPVSRARCRARRARSAEFDAIARLLESRSRRLGTSWRRTDGGLTLDLADGRVDTSL